MTPLMYAVLFRSADETNLRRIINSLLIHGAEVGMKSNVRPNLLHQIKYFATLID